MRIRIFATPAIQLEIKQIQKLANLKHKTSAIRASIEAAHTCCMNTSVERLVLRNTQQRQQFGLYIGSGVMIPTDSKGWLTVDTSLDAISEMRVVDLLQKGFGHNKQSVALRSLDFYHEILKHQTQGYELGYLNENDDDFIPIQL